MASATPTSSSGVAAARAVNRTGLFDMSHIVGMPPSGLEAKVVHARGSPGTIREIPNSKIEPARFRGRSGGVGGILARIVDRLVDQASAPNEVLAERGASPGRGPTGDRCHRGWGGR